MPGARVSCSGSVSVVLVLYVPDASIVCELPHLKFCSPPFRGARLIVVNHDGLYIRIGLAKNAPDGSYQCVRAAESRDNDTYYGVVHDGCFLLEEQEYANFPDSVVTKCLMYFKVIDFS